MGTSSSHSRVPIQRNETENGDHKSLANPALRVILLNSMNLDGPTIEPELQSQTFGFVNAAITASADVELHDTATILLTHIPLHKEAGICSDAPMFSYFDETYGSGIKEQNLLSTDISQNAILQGLFGKSPDTLAPARGMGRDGIILTGHDHEGCDVYHFVDRETQRWQAQRWDHTNTFARTIDKDLPGMREVTLRSMMGEFGGNAALVAAWWDGDNGRWRIEVENCMFGVQHILVGSACFGYHCDCTGFLHSVGILLQEAFWVTHGGKQEAVAVKESELDERWEEKCASRLQLRQTC